VRKEDLPLQPGDDLFEDLIFELFGSPDPLQVDGIGGSHSHTSKIMMITESDRDDADIEYTFGGVGIENRVIEWGGNCGNLTSAVGAFAIHENLVETTEPMTTVRLYNTNADGIVEQDVPVVDGTPQIYGDYHIDGVPGTGARVDSHFLDPAGGVLDSTLPTGNAVDKIDVDGETLEVSIVDVTNVVAYVRAADLGLGNRTTGRYQKPPRPSRQDGAHPWGGLRRTGTRRRTRSGGVRVSDLPAHRVRLRAAIVRVLR